MGKYLLRFLCVCLVTLIPKKKSIWIFGAWFGKKFSDNPKYMYQYVESLHSNEMTPVWIAKDRMLVSELRKQGINAYYHNSFTGVYYQLVSKVAFVGHSISSDLNPCFIGFNTKRVQLWHGIPLKKIGFDDKIFTSKNHLIQKYQVLFSLLVNDRYDLVISTGDKCSTLFSSAFNEPLKKIIKTGFPRNDVFLTMSNEKTLETPFKVIYMPTFRGGIGDEFDLFESYGFNLDEIDSMFSLANIELHIRTHPANCPPASLLSKIKECQKVKISTIDDIYESINSYDCLVTDYSSIIFDFILSRKPILFAPFDLENYLKVDRELYFSYSTVSEDKICRSWPELINQILDLKNHPDKFENSNQFIRSFHDEINLEGNCFSLNIYNEVNKLIDKSIYF